MAITAALLLALNGCLMPPAIDEVSPLENQPPRIIPVSPWPSGGVFSMSTACPSYTFTATLADPDRDDRLYWRAFVDYAQDPRPGDTESGEVTPAGSPVSMAFSVSPDDPRFGSRLGEAHLVELLVADRPFFNDDRVMLGRAVPEEAQTDSVIWTVTLTTDVKPCEQH